jgi:hypothetical protein
MQVVHLLKGLTCATAITMLLSKTRHPTKNKATTNAAIFSLVFNAIPPCGMLFEGNISHCALICEFYFNKYYQYVDTIYRNWYRI